MATYAIGDIHGCYKTFRALLREVGFRPKKDRLWLVGDLVNRGPRSLQALRWAADHDSRIVAVLGNHDLHALARGYGLAAEKPRDTLDDLLEAPDAPELLEWLRHRPLFFHKGRHALLHAGLQPAWTLGEAARLAAEVEEKLRRKGPPHIVTQLRAQPPVRWQRKLPKSQRRLATLYAFTLLRTCKRNGEPCSRFSGNPTKAPRGCHPWFSLPSPRDPDVTLVTGHWAALGLFRAPGLTALDSGCIWGGPLTAMRLEDGQLFQVPNQDGGLAR